MSIFCLNSFGQVNENKVQEEATNGTPYYSLERKQVKSKKTRCKKKESFITKIFHAKHKDSKLDTLFNRGSNVVKRENIDMPKFEKPNDATKAESNLLISEETNTKYKESIKAFSEMNKLNMGNADTLQKEAGNKAKDKALEEGKRLGNQEIAKDKDLSQVQKYSQEMESIGKDSLDVDKLTRIVKSK